MNQDVPKSATPPASLILAVKELLRVDAIGTRVSSKFSEAIGALRESFGQLTGQPAPDGLDRMTFAFQDPTTGEIRAVVLLRGDIQRGMSLELEDKLNQGICKCGPNGETNVVDCSCSDLAERFELLDHLPTNAEPVKTGRDWPKARDVGRYGDMSPLAHLRVGLDADNDVYVSVHDGSSGGSLEFCTPFSGGGKSPRTREALINLMLAMEQDNIATPAFNWWERGAKTPEVSNQ